MASLVGLTKRIASAPVTTTIGTAKNIGSMIKGSVIGSTGISSLRPTNILAASMEAAGIGGLVPATLGAGGAGQGTGFTERVRAAFSPTMRAPATPAPAPAASGLEGLILKLIDINTAMLDVNNKVVVNTSRTNDLLSSIIGGQKQQLLTDIENAREARIVKAANDNARAGTAPKAPGTSGAGIMGLLSMIPGFGLLKTLFSSITDAMSTLVSAGGIILKGLLSIGRFLIRFAGPIGAVVGLLLALEAQDWEKFFGRFTSAFKDFMEGRWLEGIAKVVIALPELIVKGIGRVIARIAEFFGFDKFAQALDEVINDFDLLEIFKAMFNYVKDIFVNIKDTVVNFFTDAKNKLAEWWASFSIVDPIIDAFNFVKDGVVNAFNLVKETVGNWLAGAADIGNKVGEVIGGLANNVWEFFKSLPGKLVDAASNLVPDFIKEPFRKLFGSSTPERAPTAPVAPTAATTTPQVTASSAATTTTPRESVTVQSQTSVMGNTNNPRGSAENAIQAIDNLLTPERNQTPPIQAPANQREQTFNAQSARQALESNMTAPPIVVNNTNMNMPGQAQGQAAPSARSSGAAPTAPVQSHIDRALYGNGFGAGYA